MFMVYYRAMTELQKAANCEQNLSRTCFAISEVVFMHKFKRFLWRWYKNISVLVGKNGS